MPSISRNVFYSRWRPGTYVGPKNLPIIYSLLDRALLEHGFPPYPKSYTHIDSEVYESIVDQVISSYQQQTGHAEADTKNAVFRALNERGYLIRMMAPGHAKRSRGIYAPTPRVLRRYHAIRRKMPHVALQEG